jgi:hypothetical protein
VKQNLPTRRMRQRPDFEQLKRQAKELLRDFVAGEAEAAAEVNAHYRAADRSKFALHDAQLVVARSYGFESWPKLKAYVDGVTVKRLADAVRTDDLAQVRAMLQARPELADLTMSYGDEHRPIHYAVPLGWACRWGRAGVASVMLERGADPMEADAELWARPRAWAEKMGHSRVYRVLQDYGV